MTDGSQWSPAATWRKPGTDWSNLSGYTKLALSVDDSIITSAENGQEAYNTLTAAKISANSSPAFTALLSAGFRISAGNNLTITTASNNTIQLDAKPTGLTSISAGGNGNVNKNYTDNLSLSATSPVKFVTAANNVLGVGVESATLQAGQGISFYKAGTIILGISADAQSPEPGHCIEIGADNSINLSADLDVKSIVVSGDTHDPGEKTLKIDYKWISGTNNSSSPDTFYLATNYLNFQTQVLGLGPEKVWIDGMGLSASGYGVGNASSTSWSEILAKLNQLPTNFNYVKANGIEDITLSTALPANTASMLDGVIYLV